MLMYPDCFQNWLDFVPLFGMLIYPDYHQNWIIFGHSLLIFLILLPQQIYPHICIVYFSSVIESYMILYFCQHKAALPLFCTPRNVFRLSLNFPVHGYYMLRTVHYKIIHWSLRHFINHNLRLCTGKTALALKHSCNCSCAKSNELSDQQEIFTALARRKAVIEN